MEESIHRQYEKTIENTIEKVIGKVIGKNIKKVNEKTIEKQQKDNIHKPHIPNSNAAPAKAPSNLSESGSSDPQTATQTHRHAPERHPQFLGSGVAHNARKGGGFQYQNHDADDAKRGGCHCVLVRFDGAVPA